MARSVHRVDPERVRRAAEAFLAGECDLESAGQRAGCHPDSVSRMASKLRKERGTPPAPRRPPTTPDPPRSPGLVLGPGTPETRRKNTRRAAIARRMMALANNTKNAGG